MKNIVTKGALVAAVAAACGYASAATVGPKNALDFSKNVSLEGATLGASIPNSAVKFNLTVTTEVSHFAGDEWRLTLSRGSWASAGASGFTVACTSGNVVLDAVPTVSGGTMTFTVAATSGTTSAAECTFASLGVAASTLTAGNVSVAFAARRPSSSTFDRDVGTSTANTFSVVSQLGAISVTSAFNGVVDYQGSAGKGFEADDGTGLVAGKEDALVITLAAGTANTAYSLTGNASLNVVLNAESGKKFSFLDANQDGTCSADEWAATTTSNGSVGSTATSSITINSACSQLTFVRSNQPVPGGVAGSTTFTIAMGSKFSSPSVGTSGLTITPMDFPATSSAALGLGSTTLASATTLDAGSWTSNGSTVVIPYMPANTTVGTSKIQPVIYVTNRSEVSGPATAAIRNESGVSCTADLGTIGANRTVNVSTAVTNAIATCYNTSDDATATGHRLSIVITASLPSATTEVYSGFTVGGSSRVSVVNSSNGK